VAGCPAAAILDFSASISPLGPPKSALAAIEEGLGSLTAYPDPNYGELRAALSEALKVDPDWILPGNGSAELLTWAARDLSELDGTYLVTPAFGDYFRALKAFGVQVLECPLDLEMLRSELGSGAGNAVTDGLRVSHRSPFSAVSNLPVPSSSGSANRGLLLNNPHNPVGLLFGKEAILPFVGQLGLVVVDEAFMDFLPPETGESLISAVSEFPNLAILRSLTKFYSLPGLRLGCAIAHPDLLRRWQLWRDPWPVNALAAAAAVAALRDAAFERQTWDWLPGARRELFEGLAELPGLRPFPGAANFLLVESSVSVAQLQKSLLEQHRILIRDCLSFPQLGDRFFRVAVRESADNLRLIAAIKEVSSQ
jgi:L-threonine-O-3-phosphate decarboxylase